MASTIRVLIVEDSEDDAQLLVRRLRQGGMDVDAERVDTADAMRTALRRHPWDLVLSDYSIPGFGAFEARTVLNETGIDIPFIIVSGTIGEETAVTALKSGAHDFLTKHNLARLVPAIERELREAEERRRRRDTERALMDTRERMRFALESAGVGTWEWEVATGRVLWSEVLERLHGLLPGTFGATYDAFLALIHPEDQARVRDASAPFLATPAGLRIEYRVGWPDGSVHWIASTGRAFFDAAGRPVRAAGISIDITTEKELQQRLIQAQKMESIGNLAGGIAHDFNNLLTAVAGYCHLLEERPSLDPEARRDLGEIRRAVDRAAALTGQLLAFSRRQLLAPRIVSLNGIISDLRPMLGRLIEESVQLEFRLDPELAPVSVDPGQMDQVLINLAVNARDAMPEGGKLAFRTKNVTFENEYNESQARIPSGRHVMLTVSDTGEGMSPDVQRRVFEPFFTTKSKGRGTGLGLATVYGIVKQSGGFIFVSSRPGRGTTFTLYFPAASGKPQADTATPKAVPSDLHGKETILLVEDDARLRKLDERILARYGYRVLVAPAAADAIRICSDYGGPIHVVLTDVVMPGGSGRTIGDWIAENRPETKLVYMSGYTDSAIARHGVLEPGIRFIQKPFSPEELVRKVREALS